MDRKTGPSPASSLSVEEVAYCNREAQKEGLFAGVTSGLAGGLIGARFFKFNRNTTLLTGILTGVMSGYFFTQAFLSTRLQQAATQKALIANKTSEFLSTDSESTTSSA